MKLIIAGTRDLVVKTYTLDVEIAQIEKMTGKPLSEVASGGAKGVDETGECYARLLHHTVKRFPANWDANGKAAGPIRNGEMAHYADAALIFMRKNMPTPGSCNMLGWMLLLQKPVRLVAL